MGSPRLQTWRSRLENSISGSLRITMESCGAVLSKFSKRANTEVKLNNDQCLETNPTEKFSENIASLKDSGKACADCRAPGKLKVPRAVNPAPNSEVRDP